MWWFKARQTELRGRSERLITDLAGGSPRRCTPRRGARLHQAPAAGCRWRWPFHRSAPEAAAFIKLIHIQTTNHSLKKTTLLASLSSQRHSPIPWQAATPAVCCTCLWKSSWRWCTTWDPWLWPEETDAFSQGSHEEHLSKTVVHTFEQRKDLNLGCCFLWFFF